MTNWHIWEIMVNIIVLSSQTYLLYKQLGVSNSKKTLMYVGLALIVALISIFNFVDVQMTIPITTDFNIYSMRLVSASLSVLYAFVVFKGSLSEKVLWSFVPMLISAIADSISIITTSLIFKENINSVIEFGDSRFWGTVINSFLISISCIVLANTGKTKKAPGKIYIPINIQIILILILLLGTFTTDILTDNALMLTADGHTIMNIGEVITLFTFLAIIIFTFVLVTRVGMLTSENMAYALKAQQSKLEKGFFSNIELTLDKLHTTKHDLHNHMRAMQVLLENNHLAELKEYFNKMNGELDSVSDVIITSNKALNSIIYSKTLAMRSKNISFHHLLSDTEKLKISEYDMCSIFGNLLDNAIEACSKLDSANELRYIRLTAKYQESMLILSISNSYNGKYTRVKRNGFISNKNGAEHGIGLRHVEGLIAHYGGHMQIVPKLTEFAVTAFIPCVSIDDNIEE